MPLGVYILKRSWRLTEEAGLDRGSAFARVAR